jgi:hypothetical protein
MTRWDCFASFSASGSSIWLSYRGWSVLLWAPVAAQSRSAS